MDGGSHLPVCVRSGVYVGILCFVQDDRVWGLRGDEDEFEIFNFDHRTSTSIGRR